MCIAAYLSFFLVGFSLSIVPRLIAENDDLVLANASSVVFQWPEELSNPGVVGVLTVMIPLALVLGIGMGTWIIYSFCDRSHFGEKGLVRWTVFGMLFALLFHIRRWLWPSPETLGILEYILGGIIPIASYLLAFRVIRKKRASK
jgi:hypothetical protein